ncbi:MAG: substrate-binding domain-containing protein, partial [bacterium]
MKVLKYIICIWITLFAVFFLTACQSEQVSNNPPKKTLGVSMASMKEDVFSIMKEAMYDNKERDNIDIIWLNAKDDEEQQKKDISYLIEQDVDLIIMNPVNTKDASKLVEKINENDIPVLALDRIVNDVQLAGYITSDSFRVGLEQAKYLSGQINHQGNIILLKGDKENNVAYEITAGNME